MDKTKILVVDDEEEICNTTKNFLTRKGYEVFTALTRDAAIESIKQNQPNLVLLDIRLKETSGIDILKEIKQLDKNIKVIMVTALDDAETIRQAKSLGADDYIAKPFSISYLNDVLMQKLSTIALKDKIERNK